MARRLTLKELKKIVEAEMKNQQEPDKVKVIQRPWWDVEGVLANEIEWMKALGIKELFQKRLGKKNG